MARVTMGLGVNCSPDGADSTLGLMGSGATWVRLVLKPTQPSKDLARRYRDAGLKVLWACDADTTAPFGSQRVAAQSYRLRLGDQIDAVQVPFNEFDITGATSSTRSELETFEAVQAWSQAFRPLGIPIVGPGLASGQPDRWSDRCDRLVDAIALHLYSPDPSEMLGTAGAFKARWRRPIWVTEWPLWSEAHAQAAVQASDGPAFVYCWHSWKNTQAEWADGLLDLQGTPTWRMAEFTKLARSMSMATVDEDIALLKKQQALTIEGMRRIAQGKITGADGVAGIIDTVDPANAGKWTPVPLPK